VIISVSKRDDYSNMMSGVTVWSSNGNAYIKQLFCFWWWNVTMADRHDWDIQCHTHNITVWRAILLETQRTFSKDDKRVYLIWLTDSYFFLKISVGSKGCILYRNVLKWSSLSLKGMIIATWCLAWQSSGIERPPVITHGNILSSFEDIGNEQLMFLLPTEIFKKK
jgi:hypothetical protein